MHSTRQRCASHLDQVSSTRRVIRLVHSVETIYRRTVLFPFFFFFFHFLTDNFMQFFAQWKQSSQHFSSDCVLTNELAYYRIIVPRLRMIKILTEIVVILFNMIYVMLF